MMKTVGTALMLVAVAPAFSAPGDLAFTAFNADEDGWAMVSLVDLAPNTTIYFTDNEWNGQPIGAGGAFNTGESYHQWSTGSSVINAGTVVRFSSIDTTSLAASLGTLTRATVSGSTNYGINQTADTVYAYLGTSATTPTSFLGAISNGGFTAAEGPLANTGLSVGTNAVQLTNSSDYAEYIGPRSGLTSFAQYQPLVANVAQWQVEGDGTFAANVPNTTAFTIAPIPEPETYALMLLGIGALGLVTARRRSRA